MSRTTLALGLLAAVVLVAIGFVVMDAWALEPIF